ncbi:MAG: BamA/TamA family outer membrane protein [Phycisphaerae bacterium]|nr:BamA/TamA family outer membrane protein [Phycisphaerae bacterium]
MMPNLRMQSLKAKRIGFHMTVGCVWMLLGMTGWNAPAARAQDAASESEIFSTRTDIVRSIEFQGNTQYKDKILGQRIGIKLGDQIDPFMVEESRRTIVDLYKKKGYVFVQVAVDRDMAEKGQLFFTITEGARVRVKAVQILGAQAFSSGDLKKIIKTKTRRMFALAAFYSEQAVEEDTEKLREFYYDRGYLGYSVETAVDFVDDNSAAVVTFTIDEGQPYRITEVEFLGQSFFDRATLEKELTLLKGDVYKKSRAIVDKRALTQKYLEKGFVDIQIYQEPKFAEDLDDHTVVLSYEIHEGRQFRIGRIDITGNQGVQDKVARNVLNEYDVTPGRLYNAKIAPDEGQKSLMEKYIQRSTLAEEVIIQPVNSDSGDPDVKDMRVDIKEGMTGMIMPGVGISSDSGVMGQLIYQQQNFDITDWPESWKEFFTMKAFRGGGQNMRIALEPGTIVSRYTLTFSNPYWHDKPIGYDLSLMSYSRWLESYDERRMNATVGWEHRKWGKWRKSIALRTEQVSVEDLDYDAPQEIRDVTGDTMLYGVRLGTGQTKVDDIYLPTEGHVFRVGYEQVTGDYTFGILSSSYVHYFNLYEDILERRTVLATKVQGGTILGNAPPFEKFYAGGQGTYAIRGFDYRGVSTRGLQVFNPGITGTPTYKDPIGSDWIFTANGEVTIPLIGENFSALTFLDSALIDTGGLRSSTGAGIQILIPQWFGPVPMRFEYGIPLQSDEKDDIRHFNFSMGRLF